MRLLIIYISLFVLAFLIFGCKTLDVKGDTVYQIWPQDGYAEEMQIAESCPVEPTEPVTINLLDQKMSGVICIPYDQAMKYKRKHNKECADRLIEQQKMEASKNVESPTTK